MKNQISNENVLSNLDKKQVCLILYHSNNLLNFDVRLNIDNCIDTIQKKIKFLYPDEIESKDNFSIDIFQIDREKIEKADLSLFIDYKFLSAFLQKEAKLITKGKDTLKMVQDHSINIIKENGNNKNLVNTNSPYNELSNRLGKNIISSLINNEIQKYPGQNLYNKIKECVINSLLSTSFEDDVFILSGDNIKFSAQFTQHLSQCFIKNHIINKSKINIMENEKKSQGLGSAWYHEPKDGKQGFYSLQMEQKPLNDLLNKPELKHIKDNALKSTGKEGKTYNNLYVNIIKLNTPDPKSNATHFLVASADKPKNAELTISVDVDKLQKTFDKDGHAKSTLNRVKEGNEKIKTDWQLTQNTYSKEAAEAAKKDGKEYKPEQGLYLGGAFDNKKKSDSQVKEKGNEKEEQVIKFKGYIVNESPENINAFFDKNDYPLLDQKDLTVAIEQLHDDKLIDDHHFDAVKTVVGESKNLSK